MVRRNESGVFMAESKQLLHFVFGGELKHTHEVEFKDLTKLDFVGMYPNFAEAKKAWRAKAQATVDNAQIRYFVVHMHRLMEPDDEHHH
jgi:Domain of unknown function (DUF4170)